VSDVQRLAALKIFKNGKNTKAKYHFLLREGAFSCQNALKKACFFCQ